MAGVTKCAGHCRSHMGASEAMEKDSFKGSLAVLCSLHGRLQSTSAHPLQSWGKGPQFLELGELIVACLARKPNIPLFLVNTTWVHGHAARGVTTVLQGVAAMWKGQHVEGQGHDMGA